MLFLHTLKAGVFGLPNHDRKRLRHSCTINKESNGHPVFAFLATIPLRLHSFIRECFPETSCLDDIPNIFSLVTHKYLWQSLPPWLICISSNVSRFTGNIVLCLVLFCTFHRCSQPLDALKSVGPRSSAIVVAFSANRLPSGYIFLTHIWYHWYKASLRSAYSEVQLLTFDSKLSHRLLVLKNCADWSPAALKALG